jgi:ectoine hydroxylase-related dioxygenase (phytanoyl-CoA dioxygenase family)
MRVAAGERANGSTARPAIDLATEASALVPDAGVRAYREQGFLRVAGVVSPADVRAIRHAFRPVFERFATLPRRMSRDLGTVAHHGGPAEIPEISRLATLLPGVATLPAFDRCRAVAARLLGAPAHYRSDHAIFKPPHNGRETPWHQDEAYGADRQVETVHLWLALQDVSVEMGCLQFVPCSHLAPVRPHHVRDRAAEMLTTEVEGVEAVAVPLRAGDLTAHHPRTLHYSGPNTTDQARLAWVLHFSARPSRFRLVVDPPPALAWTRPLASWAWRVLAHTLP